MSEENKEQEETGIGPVFSQIQFNIDDYNIPFDDYPENPYEVKDFSEWSPEIDGEIDKILEAIRPDTDFDENASIEYAGVIDDEDGGDESPGAALRKPRENKEFPSKEEPEEEIKKYDEFDDDDINWRD
ncbi:MAG: hypothetical protein GX660_27885 [Clostridiaceae bacterium]|nr:hypothetical protein [Clostridiaceae bacterium]